MIELKSGEWLVWMVINWFKDNKEMIGLDESMPQDYVTGWLLW